jgi:sensor domain CHASE-containing protein
MPPAEAFAAATLFASIAMVVLGAGHYVTKLARLRNARQPADVENRLARLEVAIDDMTAALNQMSETQRFLTTALAQRGLPAEVPHGSK